VAAIVKAGASELGFDPATFDGHSLRAGFVTSDCRDAELFVGNAAAGLL
jgi:hypothetical protein